MTIRIVDIESEGLDPTIHRVVEIASVDVDDKSGQLQCPQVSLVNPGAGRSMPPDAQGIHHISSAILGDAPPLEVVQKTILTQFPFPHLTAFCAHNAAFESEFLKQFAGNVPWLCTLKVAARLWPDAPNLKNQTLRYVLNLVIPERYADPNSATGIPHRALPDAVVTACILQHIIRNQLASIPDMLQWSQEPLHQPVCPIGKKQGHAGKPWHVVDGGFLRWVVSQNDMDPDTKYHAQFELNRRQRGDPVPAKSAVATPIPMPPGDPPPSPLPPFPPPIPRPRPPAPPPLLTGEQSLVKFVGEDAALEPPLPTPAMREGFLNLARGAITEAKSVSDLEGWFRDARDVGMPAAGIIANSAEYNEIVMLCRTHKLRLQLAKATL